MRETHASEIVVSTYVNKYLFANGDKYLIAKHL